MDRTRLEALKGNLERVIKGKGEVIELAIVCLLARGHLLIEDVPGVGKTTLAHALARSINCTFQRIQFTSDLLPSDIIGVTIYNQAKHSFEFRPGPIFANIVLADEINRTTPKTQSALLEAMNDHQVSIEKTTYPLPEPFMVLATQNPLEYEGTYPLPESQLDRFTMQIRIGYPDMADEKTILLSPPRELLPQYLTPVLSVEDVLTLQGMTEKVRVDEDLVDYLLNIVKATRESTALKMGVSPRGAMALYRVAQAHALLEGRDYCIPDDVKGMAPYVFSHRIIPGYQDEGMEGVEKIIREIVEGIEVPL